MPTKSPKQARTMRAAAHSEEFAKKVGIPVAVAKEFVEADKKAKEKEADDAKKKAKADATKNKHHASSSITTKYKKEA